MHSNVMSAFYCQDKSRCTKLVGFFGPSIKKLKKYSRRPIGKKIKKTFWTTPGINGMHQVVFFHGNRQRSLQVYGRGVVNNNVNATKVLSSFFNGILHLGLISDINLSKKVTCVLKNPLTFIRASAGILFGKGVICNVCNAT